MEKFGKFIRSWGVPIFAAICGVVAFCMIYVKAIVVTPAVSVAAGDYTGVQIALGFTKNETIAVFSPSAGVILAYLFPLAASCVIVIGKGIRIAEGIASALFLAGGILLLCLSHLLRGPIDGSAALSAAPIAAGVLALLGAVAAAVTVFLKEKPSA